MSDEDRHQNGNYTPTVFVVDDEEMVTSALEAFLGLETTYKVEAFNAPKAALERLNGAPVDVVVADFLMPDMDGIEFLREVRDSKPEVTRILLTGYADKQNAIRAINEVGLYYYLEKPWDNDQLLIIIRNAIERARLFRDLGDKVNALETAHDSLASIRQRLIKTFV
jgi:DNA-binding NtrC family response regulator